MYIHKVLPFAGPNGYIYWVRCNCLSSYSLGKLLCPYSQPWDPFTSAIWVKSLSVTISKRPSHFLQPGQSACKTTLPGQHHLKGLQFLKYILLDILCHKNTQNSPCNGSSSGEHPSSSYRSNASSHAHIFICKCRYINIYINVQVQSVFTWRKEHGGKPR